MDTQARTQDIPQSTPPDPRAIRRVVISALVGASIEWYDFFLYGVVAGIVFNKLYFPASDPVVSTLLAYTTFAVGFVTRGRWAA
jgi:MHS family shikimate/dehydroshikimate transporter-like MFS transporter